MIRSVVPNDTPDLVQVICSSGLFRAVEDSIRAVNGRLLLIETSDKSSYERTRLFYQKRGYTEVARIPDYFTDGDGKVSFVKRL